MGRWIDEFVEISKGMDAQCVDPPKFVCVFFLWGPFPGDESGCIDSGEGIVEFHKEFQHRTISALIKRRERVPSFRLFRKREHGVDAV